MAGRRVGKTLRLVCALAWCAVSRGALASEYHGQVTLGGLPVPGATVTAEQGAKRAAAVSDAQGIFSFPDLADGSWSIQVEMTGFAPIKQDVTVTPNAPAVKWELKLLSLDQIRAAAKPVKVDSQPSAPAPSASVIAPAAAAPAAAANSSSKNAKATATATPAPAAAGTGTPPPPPPPDLASQSASDGLLINGSVNNAATSQFALAPAFGNSRNGGRGLYNGGITVNLGNSALNARSYSLTGQETPKPSYSNTTINATLFGPFKIPHLLKPGPNFSISYARGRTSNDITGSYLVPTAAERSGNFSGVLNSLGQPLQIYNPATGQPFTGNVGPLSPQAVALLSFYPLPNVTGDSTYNYQTPIISSQHLDAVQLRLNNFGIRTRDHFNGSFAFQSVRNAQANLFGFVDATDSLGINSNLSWQHRFRQRLYVTLTYNYSRLRNQTRPNFDDRENIEAADQINGTATSPPNVDPADWGPPGLSFSSGIAGLGDANSAFNRNQTNALNVDGIWNRQRHNVHFGGDFRRLEFNVLAQANPRGTFGFTGAATGNGTTGTGSDFADFLLGIPDTSAIAYGNADKYLRNSTYDLFALDDWRVRPELTINAGVRWEYGAPPTELFGRLVNLDVASGFTAVAPVLGSNPVGALTGQTYPTSLIRPDKNGVAPNIGISWRPISGSSVLVKAGYGINHNTANYQSTTAGMDQQAPLSKSLSVANSAGCPLTLADGFNSCSTTTADTFGIDPNFRVGYLQTWQLSVQRDLPGSLQGTITYLGNKGTRGVQQFYPNTYPARGVNPCPSCPSGFSYRTSNGDSTREAGSIQLRRRLRNGFTANLTYTYSKSLDDDSFLGGQGAIAAGATSQTSSNGNIAQNWLNLRGERGLSSNDQRHLLNVQLQYTTGMGLGGRTLLSGWRGRAYKDWTIVTNISVGTGLPETPTYIEALEGSACTTCIRPNVTGASIHAAPAGLFLNPAAFSAPLTGQFGNARVGSITGPNSFTLNTSAQRSFRLHDRYTLTARIDSTNALNHVVYSSFFTTVNSSQFGGPAGTNAMRAATATMSLRF
jgi:hypothetical protein